MLCRIDMLIPQACIVHTYAYCTYTALPHLSLVAVRHLVNPIALISVTSLCRDTCFIINIHSRCHS